MNRLTVREWPVELYAKLNEERCIVWKVDVHGNVMYWRQRGEGVSMLCDHAELLPLENPVRYSTLSHFRY